jgi:hypothetical protein
MSTTLQPLSITPLCSQSTLDPEAGLLVSMRAMGSSQVEAEGKDSSACQHPIGNSGTHSNWSGSGRMHTL